MQRVGADEARIRSRVAGLLHPLEAFQHLLDRNRPWHRVDHCRQIAKRHVLVEVQVERHRHAGCRREVEQLRLPGRQRNCGQETEEPEARHFGDRTAGYIWHAGFQRAFHAQEHGAVDTAKGLAGVIDAVAIEVGASVTVHVDAHLDLSHQLHQVDHGLAQAIAAGDGGLGCPGVDAFGRVDRAVAVLVEAASARGHHHRRTGGGKHVERAERAAAMSHHVDRDRGDALGCEHRRHRPWRTEHAVTETVAENCHRPAARRTGALGQEQLEHQLVGGLHRRLTGQGAGCRDELARIHVVGRAETAKRHATHRARHDAQRGRGNKGCPECRRGSGLQHPLDSRQACDREHRARRAAVADHEVGRCRLRAPDLPMDLRQVGADALRREQAHRDDAVAGRPARVFAVHQRPAVTHEIVVAQFIAVGLLAEAAVLAGLDRVTRGIAHTVRDHQHITRVFIEQFVGFEYQRLARHIPRHLVDADPLSKTLAGGGIAQVDQVHRLAAHARQVDVAGEGYRNARLGVEAVQGVDDIDVGAVGRPHGTVRLGQLDAPEGVLRPVDLGEPVTRKRARRRARIIEAHADPGRRGEQGRRDQRGDGGESTQGSKPGLGCTNRRRLAGRKLHAMSPDALDLSGHAGNCPRLHMGHTAPGFIASGCRARQLGIVPMRPTRQHNSDRPAGDAEATPQRRRPDFRRLCADQ